MKTIHKRRKAFIGAAISVAAGIAQGLINRNQQKKAQARQNAINNRQATYQAATNLTNSYADQSYVDDFHDRIEFACGGKKRMKSGGKYNKRC